MGLDITKEKAFLAEVDDTAGVLAQVAGAVADAGINLSFLAGWPASPGRAMLCSIPDNPQKLKELASSYGIALKEQTVFIARGDDRAGALAQIARKLGDAGINIRDLAALSVGGQFAAAIYVAEAEVPRAAAALGC